jgi:DNA-binding NarL/FixJ family response regulator
LRKILPVELQVRCLEKVGAGKSWIEKDLLESILSTKRTVLSMRERQLAELLMQGLSNKEIGYRLVLSEGTVKVYFSRLFQKVGVSDRFELALFAVERVFGGQFSPAGRDVPVVPVVAHVRAAPHPVGVL